MLSGIETIGLDVGSISNNWLFEARTVAVALRGQRDPGIWKEVTPLIAAARESGSPQNIAQAYGAAAPLLLAGGQSGQARALLDELATTSGMRADPYYAAYLTRFVRCAQVLEDETLAARLTDGVEPRTPMQQHALVACRAVVAELRGDHQAAAATYSDAASRWREFGDLPERAYALLGHGRCLMIIGARGSDVALREARNIFTSIGFSTAVSETEGLLQRTTASTS